MGMFSKDIKTLDDLLSKHGLQDLYYAENQIAKALPAMIDKAGDERAQARLEAASPGNAGASEAAGAGVQKITMRSRAARNVRPSTASSRREVTSWARSRITAVLNVGIIAAAQAVEHYEITRYGALIAWAKQLGHRPDATILARNLRRKRRPTRSSPHWRRSGSTPSRTEARPAAPAIRAARRRRRHPVAPQPAAASRR